MKVLSLFNGISCGRLALERAGIKVSRYVSYEIDEFANSVAKKHFPNDEYSGDVCTADFAQYEGFDYVIGGSPCQDFSFLKFLNWEVLGEIGEKSRLCYEFFRAIKEVKPKYFLFENVVMKKESQDLISKYLGVQPIKINSSLVSIQNRNRLYWTNIPNVVLPTDKGFSFQDYKDTDTVYCDLFKVNLTPSRQKMWGNGQGRSKDKSCDNITYSKKIGCITCKQDRFPNAGLVAYGGGCRYLTLRELELGQTLPIGYVSNSGASRTKAEALIGNGWTVDIIAHILSFSKTADVAEST